MNEQINFKKTILAFKKNKGWILAIIGITVICMFVYLHFIATPIYQKNTQILVNQSDRTSKSNILDSQTVQADLQLINTYSTIITSPRILNKVQQNIGIKYDIQELAEMVQVKNTANSQVIDISVQNPDPKVAAEITNITAKIFKEEIPNIMKIDNVTTLSEAQSTGNETPVKPQKALMMILAFFVGVLFAFCFVFIKLLFDRSFNSKEEVTEFLGLHVLGEVSLFPNGDPFQMKIQEESEQ
ncbi:capsular biosynthesis protein [Listeria grandensis]|uniref:Capsular biosynthesis protein n=1 Tax=Listeria grandensis TaxID=1494963 RepID=A0A7X0Y4F0_9LIST|nr:Wzz/FepE/Etk N-terminal domain-containing protein [Listeria grandensis]MBC1936807.1 capsular biosynthesis protein [Listeria grandensis]